MKLTKLACTITLLLALPSAVFAQTVWLTNNVTISETNTNFDGQDIVISDGGE
jgi:hypothetical protein